MLVEVVLWAKRPRNEGFCLECGPPASPVIVICRAGECKEGFFVAYKGAYSFRFPYCQFRPTVKPLTNNLIEFSSLVVSAYGDNSSGVYELQVDRFCVDPMFEQWPPKPSRVQVNLPPGEAKVKALLRSICRRETEIAFRGKDAQILSQYEQIWKRKERKELLASIATILVIPTIFFTAILFTTFWFFARARKVKLGAGTLLSAVEPLLVQVILLLILFPACFEFIIDPDDQGFAIFLEVTLAAIWFAEFRSLGRVVRKRALLHSSPAA